MSIPPAPPRLLKILFLCTGNACRSQMAEGWARHLNADRIEAWSAGIAPAGVDPRAVQVMREVGVDISGHRSKHVNELLEMATLAPSAGRQAKRNHENNRLTDGSDYTRSACVPFDWVVTVCDHASENCPVFPGKARRFHRGFNDPPMLARGESDPEVALHHYRRVRDEIRAFIESLPGALT